MTGIVGGGSSWNWARPVSPGMPNLRPAEVSDAPSRDDYDMQFQAEQMRKKYGLIGGRVPMNLTGGMGVAASSIYTAATNVLGGSA